MNIDLSPSQQKIVCELLAQHVPECEVRAFGSRVRWTAKDYSDLDLAVVGKDRLDKKRLANLQEAFQESELPFRVDVHDWHGITEKFRKVIAEKFEIIQGVEASPPTAAPLRGSSATPLSGGHPRCAPELNQEELDKMQDWKPMKWGDLITLEYGKALRNYQGTPGAFRVFGTNGPIGWCAVPLCKFPSVIVGRKGAYRGIFYSSAPFFVIDTGFYLNPKKEFDMRWAYYELLTHDINGMDSGSAIPSTSRDSFYLLNVNVPPLPEQRAIAHILGSLDDRIELNRKMNETLEAMARTLFQSWFVDFDPVIDKALASRKMIPAEFAERAERRKALGTQRKVLPKEVLALFPDEFEESPMGWIPKGWETPTLYDLAEYHNGIACKEFVPRNSLNAVPVVKIVEIKNGVSDRTDFTNLQFPNKALLTDGDILFSWSGNPDTSIDIFVWTGGRAWLNQHIFRVCAFNPKEHVFAYYLLKYLKPVFAEIARDKQTTGLGHVTVKDLKRLSFAKPSKHIIEAFTRGSGSLFDRWYQGLLDERDLTAIRDTLLPKLISGELSIPDAENLLDGVAPSQPIKVKATAPIAVPVSTPVRETRAEDYTAEEVLALIRKSFRTLSSSVTDDELIHAVAQEMGYQRVRENVTSVIKNHLRTAIHRQVLLRPKKGELQLQTTSINDYSTKDLATIMATVQGKNKAQATEELFRNTLAHLGFTRLSNENRVLLEKAMRSAKRSGILGNRKE